MLYFVGPGWLVSIAYIDPGNYQADIQAGATTQYYLLFTIWWSSVLSIYVQVLCVRLGYYAQQTLAEVQAHEFQQQQSTWRRYFAWFLAEFSVILTDLPEVIGIGIACNLFFGWPYWIGVLMSLVTTMLFLGTMQYGMHILEYIIVFFVGIMSIAIFVEMSFVQPDTSELMKGWIYGFVDVTTDDLFTIAGILGAVVMPHNLYLHTATVQSRKVVRRDDIVKKAVWYCSIEPILPILISFFVNLAVVAIAAERVYGTPSAATVGLTDFCNYFFSLKGGCLMWGIALLAAGQSSAITTTYTGQFIMDGFLKVRLPVKVRAIVTRLVAITPCVIVSIFFPSHLNQMVNIVNAALGFLLPFALLPLIKYNCSPLIMGGFASRGLKNLFCMVSVSSFGLSTL
ncbi:natural resistance-associated macrophage protein [Fragilariopsis cylindrus CCMP1102]|uniref:Natural resistance-associated macrophage protein n=1 Tax=Fragilariopsis cylindrus CCMP1102 TaxID=635003 RepID=A0A1E7EYS1_9STRA|nr:natural resistance-associated macrophage protein [Fragilariopsis cylindrus CCMP1102]|eukprot:OEU10969.1 natural resistance-associated macrophage protein [Fragilariopsis cylindrus CCMP1102]